MIAVLTGGEREEPVGTVTVIIRTVTLEGNISLDEAAREICRVVEEHDHYANVKFVRWADSYDLTGPFATTVRSRLKKKKKYRWATLSDRQRVKVMHYFDAHISLGKIQAQFDALPPHQRKGIVS